MLNRIGFWAKSWSSLLAVLALSGCFDVDASSVQTADVGRLCQTIAAAKAGNATKDSSALAVEEIRKRGVFSDTELAAVAAQRVYVGMSESAMICATGNYNYGVNTTTTIAGVTRQYLIGDGTYNKRVYVYTTNGVVTAVQS